MQISHHPASLTPQIKTYAWPFHFYISRRTRLVSMDGNWTRTRGRPGASSYALRVIRAGDSDHDATRPRSAASAGRERAARSRGARAARRAACRRAPPGLAELPPTSEWTSRHRGRGSPICCSWWMMTTVGTCGLGSGPLQPAARSTTLSACCLLSHDSSVRKVSRSIISMRIPNARPPGNHSCRGAGTGMGRSGMTRATQ